MSEPLKPLEDYLSAGYEGMNSLLKEANTDNRTANSISLQMILRGMFIQMTKMDAVVELLYRMQPPEPTKLDIGPGKVIIDPTIDPLPIVVEKLPRELVNDLRAFFSQLIAAFDHTRRQYPIQTVPPFDINQWRATTQQTYDKLLKWLKIEEE